MSTLMVVSNNEHHGSHATLPPKRQGFCIRLVQAWLRAPLQPQPDNKANFSLQDFPEAANCPKQVIFVCFRPQSRYYLYTWNPMCWEDVCIMGSERALFRPFRLLHDPVSSGTSPGKGNQSRGNPGQTFSPTSRQRPNEPETWGHIPCPSMTRTRVYEPWSILLVFSLVAP